MSKYDTMSKDELIRQLANLEAKQKRTGGLSIKVSKSGAISVYGLQRWPVTLYMSQWEKLLAIKEDLERFIVENLDLLATKDEPAEPAVAA